MFEFARVFHSLRLPPHTHASFSCCWQLRTVTKFVVGEAHITLRIMKDGVSRVEEAFYYYSGTSTNATPTSPLSHSHSSTHLLPFLLFSVSHPHPNFTEVFCILLELFASQSSCQWSGGSVQEL